MALLHRARAVDYLDLDWLWIQSSFFFNQPVVIWDPSDCLVLGDEALFYQQQASSLHRLTSANLVFRALKQLSLESGSKSKSAPPNKTARQVQYANQHLIKQEHMYKRGKQHGFVWKLGTQYMEYIAICEKSGWASEPTTRCSCFFPIISHHFQTNPLVFGL